MRGAAMRKDNLSAAFPEKTYYIDALRVLFTFGVIYLHSASMALRADMNSLGWMVSNLVTSLFTIAVPVFFMMSGALILSSPKTDDLSYTLKKRVPHLVVPLLAWSLLRLLWSLLRSDPLDFSSFASALISIPSAPAGIHLWFLYYLVPLYMIAPLIKKLLDNISEKLVLYILGIWALIALLSSVSDFLPASVKPVLDFLMLKNLNFVGGELGYFVLGWYLHNTKRVSGKNLLIFVAVFMTIAIAIGTYISSRLVGYYNEMFKAYGSIYVIILSSSVFLFFKQHVAPGRLSAAVRFLAPLCFGVYLMHNFFLEKLRGFAFGGTRLIYVLGSFAVTAIVCFAAILIISRIKPLSYILSGSKYKSKKKEKISL